MNRFEKYLFNRIQEKSEKSPVRWCSFQHLDMSEEMTDYFGENVSTGDVHQMVVRMNKKDLITADITSKTARKVVADDTLSLLQKEIYRRIKEACSETSDAEYTFHMRDMKEHLENNRDYEELDQDVIRRATTSLKRKGYVGGMIQESGICDVYVKRELNADKFTTFEEFRRAHSNT